jgi:hypothetical protein
MVALAIGLWLGGLRPLDRLESAFSAAGLGGYQSGYQWLIATSQ